MSDRTRPIERLGVMGEEIKKQRLAKERLAARVERLEKENANLTEYAAERGYFEGRYDRLKALLEEGIAKGLIERDTMLYDDIRAALAGEELS